MEKQFIKGILKSDNNAIEFVASDESKDRHGDVLTLDAWDLSYFSKAPRMLVDHDHRVEKIVGKWEDVHIDKGVEQPGLKMKANFHELTDLSKQAKAMVENGYLDTVSVGFIPHVDEVKSEDGSSSEKERYELVEVSLVTVPANPNAQQIKSLLDDKEEVDEKAIEKFVTTKDEEGKEEEEQDEAEVEATEEAVEEPVAEEPVEEATEEEVGEKQKTLAKSKLSLSDDAIMAEALKECVKIINHALMVNNRKK